MGAAGLKKLARNSEEISKQYKTIMTDMYDENLWEFVSASTRVGLQNIVETNLRSEQGSNLERPLGSLRKFPSINSLTFNSPN